MLAVTLISVADLTGRVVATSMAHGEHDAVVSLKDAGAGTVMTDIRKTTSFGDLTDSFAVHFAVQDGALGADPRVVLLALAAEVPPVAWGMGAAPFVLFLGFWLAVALFFCCRVRPPPPWKPGRRTCAAPRGSPATPTASRRVCAARRAAGFGGGGLSAPARRQMCGTADTSDPRFGIFALFDNVADRSGEHGGYTDLRYGNTL